VSRSATQCGCVRATCTCWSRAASSSVGVTLDWDEYTDGGTFPRKDTLHLAAGDTVYLLHYLALGSWAWWHRGKDDGGAEFWVGPEDGELGGVISGSDSSVAVALSHPRTADWWRVETRSGASGWWRADSLGSLVNIEKDWCADR
jgi:hypothetical protein